MKQRIRVTGIIKNQDGILVLKRIRSRSEAPVFWELPTDKIKFGEQPEEAMARTIAENLGVNAAAIRIKDVITFLALEGASRLSNLYIVYEVTLPKGTKIAPRGRYIAYKYIKEVSTPQVRLNEATNSVLEIEEGRVSENRSSFRDTANSITIHVDGASRGNPGPSGVGYCIYDQDGKIIEKGGEFIGFATSRVAEYCAMKKGIERAIELGYDSVKFVSDSLMVVNQLNGVFKPKNRDIMPFYRAIVEFLGKFKSISFTHVPREDNQNADTEANRAIDSLVSHKV